MQTMGLQRNHNVLWQKKPQRQRNNVACPKEGFSNTKQCHAAPKGGNESPMSCSHKNDKGLMSCAPKKDCGNTKQCHMAQKAMPTKHQCHAASKKGHDNEAGMLWAPKRAMAMQNNVAVVTNHQLTWPQKGCDNKAGMLRALKRVTAMQNPYDDNLVVDMQEG